MRDQPHPHNDRSRATAHGADVVREALHLEGDDGAEDKVDDPPGGRVVLEEPR